jgi:6-pyruvoyltetrahydropterin/6-carboxytetrahydropterin synthase
MPSHVLPEKVTLARRAYFSSGRVLRHADWSDEKNREVFGKRARPHGHDYSLTVFYTGTPGEEDGMIVNLTDIKPILARVLAPLDGKFLNELEAFRDHPPTAENLVNFLWQELPKQIAGGVLTRLCLQEAPDFWIVKLPDTMRVTKKYEFAAAHRLHAPTLSEAENNARYGKCNNPSGHGHNYGLEITVEGTPDAQSGVLLSPETFDKIVDEEVFDRFDHKHLNEDCPEFENLIPTSENLARVIFDLLQKRIAELNQPDLKLARVGLNETQKNYFEVEA